MRYRTWLCVLFAIVLALPGMFCTGQDDDDDDTGDDDAGDGDDDDDDDNDDDDTEEPCDPTFRPLVFLHGFLENGDAFALQSMRFASNAYCPGHVRSFDWNTLYEPIGGQGYLPRLEAFVDEVLAETGAETIDLAGHSMGGWLAHEYVLKPENEAKVAHAAVLGARWGSVPEGLPTMVINSQDDPFGPGSDTAGAINVWLTGADHLEVATSAETFEHLYEFFNDGHTPLTVEVVGQSTVELSGRVQVLGTNAPVAGTTVEVFPIDPETGQRQSDEPIGSFVSDAQGFWGPLTTSPEAHHEFVLVDNNQIQPPIHYLRQPVPRSSDKIYFRVFPSSDNLIGRLVGLVPWPDYAMFGLLFTRQTVITGRDTLDLNGVDLATPELTPLGNQTIAIIFFDANFNGKSDFAPVGWFFESMSFLSGFDVRIPAGQSLPQQFTFNGRTLTMPNLSPRTDGLSIVVFD